MRRAQLSFGDGLIAAEVSDLHEDWMKQADRVLDDETIVAAVYEALARRHPNSRSRGRRNAPAEMVLRLLILKHVRNWSYAVLEREVRANLVYREFTRVGACKVPDAKTMGRWGLALGPDALKQVHDRMVAIARDQGIAAGRRMRVDTTVVETNIHYPTDSTLLGDGVRVLIRTMRRCDRGRGRNQASGSEPKREVAIAGDRADRTRQGTDQSRQAEAALSRAVGRHQPPGRSSQALLTRDRGWREAVSAGLEADGAGGAA